MMYTECSAAVILYDAVPGHSILWAQFAKRTPPIDTHVYLPNKVILFQLGPKNVKITVM